MHVEVSGPGEEGVDGEANDSSVQFEVDFAQPRGTEFKQTLSDNESASLLYNSRTYITEQSKEREKMKIAITAQGKELSSEIDLRFGRAKWIIIFDSQKGDFAAHDNVVNLNAVQGAGIQTGQNIANLDVEVVITGNVGPNAFKTLNTAGVKVFLAESQTVQQALDSFRVGKLKEIDGANVEGHWI